MWRSGLVDKSRQWPLSGLLAFVCGVETQPHRMVVGLFFFGHVPRESGVVVVQIDFQIAGRRNHERPERQPLRVLHAVH